MKINEILSEAGFWKGIAKGLAPNAVADRDAMKGFKKDFKKFTDVEDLPDNQGITVSIPSGTPGQPQDKVSWTPAKNLLNINGQNYQKTKKGWKDLQTDELIPPQYAKEIQAAFDVASGRMAAPKPRAVKLPPIQVKTPTGEIVTKSDTDGLWRMANGTVISDTHNVAELEKRAKPAYQTRQMARGL